MLDNTFDLNLMRVLVALGSTRSVTQAALLLDMSQSGFSTALARLRSRFDDVLFVRTTEGMMPTPRAQKMIDTSIAVLAQVAQGVLEQPAFDPATTRTAFHLAMADVAEIVYLPRLLKHLQIHAPHARVVSHSLGSDALASAMTAGDIDLAIGYFPDLSSQSFFHQRLYTHTYACMMRRGHPLQGTPLTLETFAAQGHATVASPARSNALMEQHLERIGIARKIVLHTPHYLSLPAIIEETDLLATVPLAAGVRFARQGTVVLVRLPFDPPSFTVQQHWHRLVHKDPRSQWLRSQIVSLFDEASNEWRSIQTALYESPLK